MIISEETRITLLDKKGKNVGVHAFIAKISFWHPTDPFFVLTTILSLSLKDNAALCSKIDFDYENYTQENLLKFNQAYKSLDF